VAGLTSLFELALTHESVPHSVLDITYRLSPPVARFISEHVYAGQLEYRRDAEGDTRFREVLQKVAPLVSRRSGQPTPFGAFAPTSSSRAPDRHSFDMGFLLHRLLLGAGAGDGGESGTSGLSHNHDTPASASSAVVAQDISSPEWISDMGSMLQRLVLGAGAGAGEGDGEREGGEGGNDGLNYLHGTPASASSAVVAHDFSSLVWINFRSKSHKHRETGSSGNEDEAKLVASSCAQLLVGLYNATKGNARSTQPQQEDHLQHGHPPSESSPLKVVILTGYKEQVQLLDRHLALSLYAQGFHNKGHAECVDWVKSSMIVNTVDSFQGQEADVVFVSTVRSADLQGLGFAKDQRRANVMLSRASQLLVVIGDADNLVSDAKSRELLLPSLAHWCSDNNAMFRLPTPKERSTGLQLVSHTLPQSQSRSSKAPQLKAAAAKKVPATPAAATSAVGNVPTLTQQCYSPLLESTLSPFAKSIIRLLLASPEYQIYLTQVPAKVPRAEWGGARSLIVPLRKIPCVSLELKNKGWVASLLVMPVVQQPEKPSFGDGVDPFIRNVRRAVVYFGGRISLTQLGESMRKDFSSASDAPRPAGNLTKLIQTLGADVLILQNGVVTLRDQNILSSANERTRHRKKRRDEKKEREEKERNHEASLKAWRLSQESNEDNQREPSQQTKQQQQQPFDPKEVRWNDAKTKAWQRVSQESNKENQREPSQQTQQQQQQQQPIAPDDEKQVKKDRLSNAKVKFLIWCRRTKYFPSRYGS
jgi:hypothetical protein